MSTAIESGAPVRLVRWQVHFDDGRSGVKTVVSLRFAEAEHKDCPSWHVAGTSDEVCETCVTAAIRLATIKQFAGHAPEFVQSSAITIGEALAKAR